MMSSRAILAAIVPVLIAYVYGPTLYRVMTVVGLLRVQTNTVLASADDLVKIADTRYCEDLHYYEPAHQLFTACEDSDVRFDWFPPLANFNVTVGEDARGSIHIIDPDVSRLVSLLGRDTNAAYI
jgi:hypothetical protein